MNTIYIKCEELVCVQVGFGLAQQVIFNPDHDSYLSIIEAAKSDDYCNLSVSDNSGEHISTRPVRVVSIKTVRKVVILTTKDL